MCALSVERKFRRQMMLEVLKSKTLPVTVRTKSGGVYKVVEIKGIGTYFNVIASNEYANFPLNIDNIVEILEE
ncbi:MAG TPA: hypothetical protein VK190_03440 [Pseudoneobacillus sp.]|nr:hypothetical protein [Pseudoneobacillus sp.]